MLSCWGMYQNQPCLLPFWITSVAPSSRPLSRYAPSQYVQIAPLLRIGSHTRRLRRFMIRPFWPLASTTTFAWTSRNAPSSPLMRTPVAREEDIVHANAFMGVHAVLARVVQHHLIELAAHHLPGLRALVRLVVPEVERRRQLPARAHELDAVLLDEVALLHLLEHAEPLQHPIRLRDQR